MTTPTPFEADCQRKRDYQDRHLRYKVCANCLVLRKFHFDTGCKWRRMNDREWADYCGVLPVEVEERYTRAVTKVEPGRILLACGHWQDCSVWEMHDPKLPTMTDCIQCKEKKGESKMFGLNGKTTPAIVPPSRNGSGAAVSPAAPASEPTKALILTDRGNGITGEVSRFLPVMDIEQAVARRNVIVQAMQQLMVQGVDYGTIPGSEKPALLKPGAQKLSNLFGLVLTFEFLEKVEDWSGEQHGGEPFFYYQLRADVRRDGFLIASGLGSCSSWEAKYRWRKKERTCPTCGKENIRKSREGGWYCWRKTEGCGAVYNDGDPAIEGQETGRKPNPDIADQVNTVLKMAEKRCMIDGVINGTSASEFFTQDVEEFAEPIDVIDLGGNRPNTRAAAQYVAGQKIRDSKLDAPRISWANMGEMMEAFKQIREQVDEATFLREIGRTGWRTLQEMRADRSAGARERIVTFYQSLSAIAREGGN